MSRTIVRAENWERVNKAIHNVNFAAFDYGAIKQSLIEYMKLYYPEVFNDFIESSELIAIIEAFAYVGDLMAYRFDMNAKENILSTADRRESILRLARYISYTTARPIPARGLVKIDSVTTTQTISDTDGKSLANVEVRWNDASNPNWKSQFINIMNTVIDRGFGKVDAKDRFQIQDSLYEMYKLNHIPFNKGVIPYNVTAAGKNIHLELVPTTYDVNKGLIERRPEIGSTMTLLYGNDGLGDESRGTGFFFYTKQGIIQRARTRFDGVTPNDTFTINAYNINDSDLWVNQVDPESGNIVDHNDILNRSKTGRSGEWIEVDAAHSENILFNTNPFRNKYEAETLDGNRVRLIFGDGNFSNIPDGTFDIWYRTSLDEDFTIPRSAVSRKTAAITYIDQFNKVQTLTIKFSLVNTLQNGSSAESNEHVKLAASAVYYSQDRMVNGEDYNVFPTKDVSILKLRTVNRTFAGDSKYAKWSESTGVYDNVTIYGNDGVIYLDSKVQTTTVHVDNLDALIDNYIEPILSSTDLFVTLITAGMPAGNMRREFSSAEREQLKEALSPPPYPNKVVMFYTIEDDLWSSYKSDDTSSFPKDSIATPIIIIDQGNIVEDGITVEWHTSDYVMHSKSTKFWTYTDDDKIINYKTLNISGDSIHLLSANINCNRDALISKDWKFRVLGRTVKQHGSEAGLLNNNSVSIVTVDDEGQTVGVDPTDVSYPRNAMSDIMVPKLEVALDGKLNVEVQLPVMYISKDIIGLPDVAVYDDDTGDAVLYDEIVDSNGIGTSIKIPNAAKLNKVIVVVKEYVYFDREDILTDWEMRDYSYATLLGYIISQFRGGDANLTKRVIGRYGLNFMWYHAALRHYLVDPTPTNIHDMFIITKGYFDEFRRWLKSTDELPPTPPTPSELRLTYGYLQDNKMISDSLVMRSGKFRLLFGSRAIPELQGRFKIIKSDNGRLTDNQLKNEIVTLTENFFNVNNWEFGETFYFEELAAFVHKSLPHEISSMVFVPTFAQHYFGDGYEVKCQEDEVFYCDISNGDIDIVKGHTPAVLKQVPTRM